MYVVAYFSKEDRDKNEKEIAQIIKMLYDVGIVLNEDQKEYIHAQFVNNLMIDSIKDQSANICSIVDFDKLFQSMQMKCL